MSINGTFAASRRSFLGFVGTSFAASMLPRLAYGARIPPVAGIQLYMVKDDLEENPADTLHKIAKIGYREVETAGFAHRSAAEFRKLVDAAGLRAPSAHLPFGMEDTSMLFDEAHALGARNVVSSILPPRPMSISHGFAPVLKMLNSMTSDDFKLVAEKANEIGRNAKIANLQYAYHNHNFEFRDLGNGQMGYDILLRETDPAVVKFEADCGWMEAGGVDPVRYFKEHPGRYSMIHVKDFKNLSKPNTTLGGANLPVSTELGRGSIDYGPILKAAWAEGVEHYFVEQEPPFVEMPALEAAAANFEVLEPLLRKL